MKNFAVLGIDQFESQRKMEGFYVNTIENHLRTAHNDIHKPHKHNFFLSVLFTHGSGIHEIDFVTYEVKVGSIFFLNPGQMHHWELSDDIRGFIFFHSQSFYDMHFATRKVTNYPFFRSIQNSSALYLDLDQIPYFIELFQQILNEFTATNLFKISKVLALIELIYIESARRYMKEAEFNVIVASVYATTFQQFERLVEENYKIEKNASQYADWLHITSKHLNRITQNMVNKTTTDIILERVFLEAKRELIFQRANFSEIALDLGYVDYAYFSRLFKKKCGMTPSQFIKFYPLK